MKKGAFSSSRSIIPSCSCEASWIHNDEKSQEIECELKLSHLMMNIETYFMKNEQFSQLLSFDT